MFSVPFIGVDENGWQLNSCVSGDLTAGSTSDDGDFIDIWDPSTEGYETWYYRSLTSGNSWRNPEKRTEKFEDVHEDGLPAGTAFWYYSQSETASVAFNFAGAVDPADDAEIAVTGSQYNMFANPYPVAFKLNEASQVDWSNVTAGATTDDGDFIDIWDPSTEGYETWYYRSLTSGNSWRNPEKRTEKFEDVHEDGLPVGTAFWYFAQGSDATITFNSPLKKTTSTEE